MKMLQLVCLLSFPNDDIDHFLFPAHAELHVKTVKYFKSIERVQEEVERTQRAAAEGAVGGKLRVGEAVAV